MKRKQSGVGVAKNLLIRFGGFTKDKLILLRSLKKDEQFRLGKLSPYLDKKLNKKITNWVKQGKAKVNLNRKGWSFLISGKDLLPEIIADIEEARKINRFVEAKFYRLRFEEFTERAWGALPQYLAPNIIGLNYAKQAAALQLFSEDSIHILLIGDPGTGKTEVLRSACELSPISSFGLGSGTSGFGLSITVKGRYVNPGLLPKAHKGVCCIDELNLMKKDDRASLYNAMEKGFVTYDKAGKHYRYEAKVKLLATANPKNDEFASHTLKDIKTQMPFDQALLSRFHLIFIVKKADLDEFTEIADRLISEDKVPIKQSDIEFLKKYVEFARDIKVKIPRHLSDKIKDFVTALKNEEKSLPFKITPRTVTGILRMVKASARMELRDEAQTKDLDRVFSIVKKSIEF